MNTPVLQLVEDDHEFHINITPPYSFTVNYEDGESETFTVTQNGSTVEIN